MKESALPRVSTVADSPETARLCKNCRWVYRPWGDFFMGFGFQFAKCRRPELYEEPAGVDRVTGKRSEPKYHYCVNCRVTAFNLCGAEGKFFEPREADTRGKANPGDDR